MSCTQQRIYRGIRSVPPAGALSPLCSSIHQAAGAAGRSGKRQQPSTERAARHRAYPAATVEGMPAAGWDDMPPILHVRGQTPAPPRRFKVTQSNPAQVDLEPPPLPPTRLGRAIDPAVLAAAKTERLAAVLAAAKTERARPGAAAAAAASLDQMQAAMTGSLGARSPSQLQAPPRPPAAAAAATGTTIPTRGPKPAPSAFTVFVARTSTPINSVPRPKTSEHAKPAKQQAALEHLEPQEARFSRDSEAGSTSPRATAELAAIVIKSSHKELLAGVPALQELSENELNEILQHVTVREYKDKEVIIEEGSAGKDMFIIQSGDAVCTKEGVNDGDWPYSFIDFVYM